MRKTIYVAAVWVLCGSALGGGLLRAQDEQPAASRKIVTKVMPEYPALARVAHLSGIAKVEAKVGSNGRVESVEIRGGHPLLAQAAANAVSKWRWEPSSHQTEEIVDVKFVADSQ